MTQLQKDALVLFKEFSHLELKMFLEAKKDTLNPDEIKVIEEALDYHRIYISKRLEEAKKSKDEGDKAEP